MTNSTTERKSRKAALSTPAYYGFPTGQSYIIRSRVRAYTGFTERFSFANGQAVAMPMREDASEEQKEARGERLGRLSSDSTYRLFKYGEEPPANLDPVWAGQEDPSATVGGEDLGEDSHMWSPAPEATKPPVQFPVEGPTPAGRTSTELAAAIPEHDRDTGEQPMPRSSLPVSQPASPAWDRKPDE